MDLDQWKKKLWDVFGILTAVLFLLGIAAAFVGIGYGIYQFKIHNVDGIPVEKVEEDNGKAGLQLTVQYQAPLPVEGADYWIVPVKLEKKKQGQAEGGEHKRAEMERSSGGYDSSLNSDISSYGYGWGPYYNLVFIHKKTGETKSLLNQKGHIEQIYIPRTNHEKKEPEEKPEFLLLKMATGDTNHDGKINGKDALPGYLVSLDGNKLTQITPDLTHLGWWQYDSEAKVLFAEAVQDLNGDTKFNWDDPKILLSVNVNDPKMGQEVVSQAIKDKIEAVLKTSISGR